MVSPNLFLKLNISFNFIIGLCIIYYNKFYSNYKLTHNLFGFMLLYISFNNIIVLKQKSSALLKKNILRLNSLLYCIIGIVILYYLRQNKKINYKNISLIILIFFAIIINYIGYKITKI